MTAGTAYSLQKKRYTQISVKKRMMLVRLVVMDGKTLSEAGRKLHINPSTVRLIIKKYKQTGTYFMKKLRNTPKEDKGLGQQSKNGEDSSEQLKEKKETGGVLKIQKEVQIKKQENVKIEESKIVSLRLYYPFLDYEYDYQ